MDVSRFGLEEDRFGLSDSLLVGGLSMSLSCSGNGVLLLSCDALCSGKTSSTDEIICLSRLSLRCELGIGTVVGSDMARFRFNESGFGATSSGGGNTTKEFSRVKVTHELVRSSLGTWEDPGCIVVYVQVVVVAETEGAVVVRHYAD